jgi:hypothetical protein
VRIIDAEMDAIGRVARSSAARPIVVTVGFLAALPLLGRADTDVVRMCEPFDTVAVADGRFIVQQNEWNSSLTQCIRVEGRAWRITRASFGLPTDGPPATYPSIFSGLAYRSCSSAASSASSRTCAIEMTTLVDVVPVSSP